MRNNLTPLRPGLTAIAAVLALSTTPAFAQEAQIAPAQDAPVIVAPPAAEAAPAPAESVTTENTASPEAAAPVAAPVATQSTPVVHTTADTGKIDPAPVVRTTAPARAHTAASVVRNADAPVAPAATPAPAPVAVPEPAPVVKTSTTAKSTIASDDSQELELAGAGALGLILIGGGIVAFNRRRNREEEETRVTPVAPESPVAYAAVETAPVTVAPATTAIEGAPTTALHESFDLSRYGAHVQAAYRGPTEDNPSLSLRHRLKRARFMDQRARETGEHTIAETPIAAERNPVTQNLFGSKLKDGLRALRPQSTMRPAFG